MCQFADALNIHERAAAFYGDLKLSAPERARQRYEIFIPHREINFDKLYAVAEMSIY
jgi:hypothetical protein